ncbi:PRD domain-containing protein [Brevibacillus invocatus]|uniref:PRD domain-containing protein n=1 Tax=Brevibacillus invocatus TaxID=173959 RepID=A0A3M8CJK2_9BACL|nr:BglG family transcription antiterminator [Brevibacillus invocatus]RNB75874.1 PRD domain-containing protein [Brevibacillus invocatus]
MSVSSRQRAIIELLLQEPKGWTVGGIAAQIKVSARTILRELDSLEALFHQNGLELVRKAGSGVELLGTDEQKQQLRIAVLQQATTEFTAEERHVMILCSLLEATEPVKLISLAIDLKVTKATISHDLDELESKLASVELSLLRKRGYGVELLGSESAKRRAISRLIADHLDDHELIGIIKDNIQHKSMRDADSLTERLLELINKEKLIKVENALKLLEHDLPYPLADSAYIGLVTHLALTVERVEKGENILFDETTLMELSQTMEYQVAQKIMKQMEQLFQIEMPTAEIGYITMHLRGAKLRNSQDEWLWPVNAELMDMTQRLIQFCEERLGVSLRDDNSLFHGLLTHLEPALYRLKSKLEIRNPILNQIKSNYPELFAVTREACSQLFPDLVVPDEEVGYLVMHIGAAVERSKQEQQRYRALVVCSSGIGSSKILATRLKKDFPEIVSLQNLSVFDVGRIPKSEYDVIISTIPLPINTLEYVVVSPLLPPDDIQKIKVHLHQKGKMLSVQKEMITPATIEQPLKRLRDTQRYTSYAVELVDGLQIRTWANEGQNIEELMLQICTELRFSGIIQQEEAVVEKLLQREKLGGLGIPGTSMALFHGKYEEVNKTSFTIHLLREPIHLKSMDEQEMSVRMILLLLGPHDVGKEGLEVLSEISSMLIEEEMQAVLETEEQQRIAEYLAEGLFAFCLKKTGLERKR